MARRRPRRHRLSESVYDGKRRVRVANRRGPGRRGRSRALGRHRRASAVARGNTRGHPGRAAAWRRGHHPLLVRHAHRPVARFGLPQSTRESRVRAVLNAAHDVLARAIEAGVFPAVTVDVGDSSGPMWQDALGISFDSLFDLASLTKPIATGSIAMRLVGEGRMSLDDLLADHFIEWSGDDRAQVTVRDLLEHASGLSARLLDAPPSGRREFEHDICVMPLEYAPRSRSIYSDLGFILLGFLEADRGDAPLDAQFAAIVGGITSD